MFAQHVCLPANYHILFMSSAEPPGHPHLYILKFHQNWLKKEAKSDKWHCYMNMKLHRDQMIHETRTTMLTKCDIWIYWGTSLHVFNVYLLLHFSNRTWIHTNCTRTYLHHKFSVTICKHFEQKKNLFYGMPHLISWCGHTTVCIFHNLNFHELIVEAGSKTGDSANYWQLKWASCIHCI